MSTQEQSRSFPGFAAALGLFAVAGFGVAITARGGGGANDGEQVVVEGSKPRVDLGAGAGGPTTETFDVDEAAPVARVTMNEEPVAPAEEYVTGAVKRDELGGLTVTAANGEASLRLTTDQVRAAHYIPSDPFAPGGPGPCLDLGDGRRVPVPAEVSDALPKAVTYNRADQVKAQ